jgi:PAS domain S-box-containing protein
MGLNKDAGSAPKHFLDDGGEMGEIIRNYDWASSGLGPVEKWPHSLATTLGIILHSAFPMFLFWGKELICFYNDAFRPSLGIEGKHPAVGKTGREVWDEIWDFIGPLIEGVLTTGKPVYFQDQPVGFYRNGRMEEIYWTFSYSPAYGDDGNINGVFVTCNETTKSVLTIRQLEVSEQRFKKIAVETEILVAQRKNADQQSLESEHRLREIIESAPFPIGVYVGREMRIQLVNQSILNVWGKGPNVVGKTYFEVLPELEEQSIYPQLEKVFTTGEPFHARNQRVDLAKDGELRVFYFNYSFTPLYDTKGNIYGVMNTAADVTDIQLAMQKVEQSEKNLRSMVLQAPVAMAILLGKDHVTEVANDLIVDLWGKPREAVMNKPVFEALPDARNQGLEEVMNNVYQTGNAFMANERPVMLLRNGKQETLFLNFVYDAYKDSEGKILGVLAIATDVTAQVLARLKIEEIVADRTKELAIANQNLERSNAELAQFAYIASHDLQEPLRKIRTYTQMLEKNVSDKIDDVGRNYFNKIQNSAARMHTLIKDVLSYSELENKKPFENVDLNDIVANIISDFELLIEQKDAVITYDPMPVVHGIPLQLSQLFGNLISNALKFTRPDVKPEIHITSKKEFSILRDREMYHILVSDNGIGFKKEFADQIFNIFQRLHRKSEFEGTGIGLAMCKKIAQNHNGDINAEGSSENGAVFNIYFPA